MIYLSRIRTGVEVLGDEGVNIISPPNPGAAVASALAPFGITQVGRTGQFRQPDLWVHDLLEGPNVVGQLVLSNPNAPVAAIAVATGLSEPDIIRDFYQGFAPGEEHWIWRGGSPWPESFDLRGVEYPQSIPAGGDRFAYTMANFDLTAAPTAPQPRGDRQWWIRTDADPEPIGLLDFDSANRSQFWLARPSFLVSRLIPPGRNGRWRFTSQPPSTNRPMVPLQVPGGVLTVL